MTTREGVPDAVGDARKPSKAARSHLRVVKDGEQEQQDTGLRELIGRIDSEAMAEENRAARAARRRLVFLTLLILLFCLWVALN